MAVRASRLVLEDVIVVVVVAVVKAEVSGVTEPLSRELTLDSPLAGVEERERRLRPEKFRKTDTCYRLNNGHMQRYFSYLSIWIDSKPVCMNSL